MQEEKTFSSGCRLRFEYSPFGSFRSDHDRSDMWERSSDTRWFLSMVRRCDRFDATDIRYGGLGCLVLVRNGDFFPSKIGFPSPLRAFENPHVLAISHQAAGGLD